MPRCLAAALLTLALSRAAAADTTHPMVDAMTRMMDSFGLLDRYRWNSTDSQPETLAPGGWTQWPGTMPGGNWRGWLPQAPADATHDSPLEGAWQAENGAVLVVRQGLARLYVSRDRYQDFYVKLQGKLLLLREAKGGRVQHYDYAMQGGRLVLLDRDGNLILFRRLTWDGR